MGSFFARQYAGYINDLKRSSALLIGIVSGILADKELRDSEIGFLKDWLEKNDAIATAWPGDIIYERVRTALSDGVISEAERKHLLETLQDLVGGESEKLSDAEHVSKFALDKIEKILFTESVFCLTGSFVYGPKEVCIRSIEDRGGVVINNVTKKLRYLIVGGLGSKEWIGGSYGTKIKKAIEYKRSGNNILIVHEDVWARNLRSSA